MSHTPGPWFDDCGNIWNESFTECIATAHVGTTPDASGGYNAQLIAAAPDLLAACKAVWSEWSDSLNVSDPEAQGFETLKLVRDAIEKAEGP